MLIPVSPSIGLPALAALVLGESAGLPIPGETALIVAGGMAATGQLSLPVVIAVAAISAIIGDSIGYFIGRRGGRKLLLRPGRFSGHRKRAVARTDRYFEQYGLITVFFARFVPGVRVVGALAAGAAEMPWRRFFVANALGCFTWAATVASIAYLVGPEGAVVMIVLGFTIAGVGLIAGLVNSRRSAADPLDSRDPLEELAAEAHSTAAAHPVGERVAAAPRPVGERVAPADRPAPLSPTAPRVIPLARPAAPAPHPATAALAAACANRTS